MWNNIQMKTAPKFILLVLLLALCGNASAQVYDTLRIATYNTLNYPGSTSAIRDPEFRATLQYIDPDILILQEVEDAAGLSQFLNNVMNYGQPGTYAAVPFSNGPDKDNGCIYRVASVSFISQTVLSTALRDINGYRFRPIGLGTDTLDIHIYSAHLKASQGYETERYLEAQILRNHLNGLTPGYFIEGGDFNLYTSTEPAFQVLTESQVDNSGRTYDPANRIGSWNENPTFADIHTQSTRTTDLGDGGSTGGLDDRFDFLLTTYNFQTSTGWQYISGSYTVVGNDGNHYNDDINDGYNAAVPANIADALHTASDHLPVYIDIRREVIGPASVTLLTPNGSEIWYTGFSRDITWTSENVLTGITLEVNRSYPSSSWETIVSGTTDDGLYTWPVSGPISEFARIRVSVDGQPAAKDSSDANFYIQSPVVTIVDPNGGETVYTGTSKTIYWSTTGVDGNVKIELNRTYPSAGWETLFASTSNDGSEIWPVTGSISSTARIRISSVVNSSVADTSSANFNIAAPYLTLVTPNGGEIWEVDDSEIIHWNYGGLSGNVAVAIDRAYPSGSWETLYASLPISSTYIDWPVTDPITDQARIRVTYIPNTAYTDTSDGDFEIIYTPGPALILHDARADTVPGLVTFTAIVTDNVPGFTTKLFYKPAADVDFDSLTMFYTGNADEYAMMTPLDHGAYDYFIRTVDSEFNVSATDTFRLMIAASAATELSYDDGDAELFNWSPDSGFSWAVRFSPPSTPFVLNEASVAIAAFSPDTIHSPIDIAVIDANGPAGMPGDTIVSFRRGSIGNIIGGFPMPGAYWTIVNLQDEGIEAPVVTGDFYIAVANGYDAVSDPVHSAEAFGLDSNSPVGRSVVYEPCDGAWIADNGVHPNSRSGNRMIRTRGWVSEPATLVIQRSGNDIELSWDATGAPYYRIYRADLSDGPFVVPMASVTTNSYLDTDAVTNSEIYFYQIRSASAP